MWVREQMFGKHGSDRLRVYWSPNPAALFGSITLSSGSVQATWNVMAHRQKPELFFRRNGHVHLNRRGRQFSRLLAAEVCVSAVVMLDTPRSEVMWRVLTTHSIRQFPLHFLSRASPCAITFRLDGKFISPAKIERIDVIMHSTRM